MAKKKKNSRRARRKKAIAARKQNMKKPVIRKRTYEDTLYMNLLEQNYLFADENTDLMDRMDHPYAAIYENDYIKAHIGYDGKYNHDRMGKCFDSKKINISIESKVQAFPVTLVRNQDAPIYSKDGFKVKMDEYVSVSFFSEYGKLITDNVDRLKFKIGVWFPEDRIK